MARTKFSVEYDSYLECFVLIVGEHVICLGSETYQEALDEVDELLPEYT